MSSRRILPVLWVLSVTALVAELLLSSVLGHHTGVLPLGATLTAVTVTVAAVGGHLE